MEPESRRRQRPIVQRIAIHATLLCGAALFAFPFFWMIATSIKTRREAGDDKQRLLPSAPHPSLVTPYIDETEFDSPSGLDGVPPAVWKSAKPKLEALIEEKLNRWKPETLSSPGNPPPAVVDHDAMLHEMRDGILAALDRRLSDQTRQAALECERGIHDPHATPPEHELLQSLSEGCISSGAAQIVKESATIIDEQMLRETFDAIYRRFCVGNVRVQMMDYSTRALYGGSEWRVKHEVSYGSAQLIERDDVAADIQEVRINDLRPDHVALEFIPESVDFDPSQIDRIFVSYRGDETWSRIRFEVAIAGKNYETRDWVNLHERDWIEQELRFESGDSDASARRNYLVLYPTGAAADSSPLKITMQVTRVGEFAAWLSKLTLNYRQTFREVPYSRYVLTSFSLAILNILLSVFSCTLVAYGFARLQWPGRDFWFVVLLATMMLPPQVTMIPSFLVIKQLGWYNTLLPLWVPATFGAPFFIFLARQFFKNVPIDLEDAARVDGCNFLGIYWNVVLPLARPVIAAIAIFTFIGTWNNFMGPLIYVNDERLFPLAMGLFKFNLVAENNVSLMMAASFLMTLPIIVLFFAMQRYFVQGITLTGVKG
ncbi:hypothetical protein BH09SUM1_BH09SUM1_33340 [soil metagenome]